MNKVRVNRLSRIIREAQPSDMAEIMQVMDAAKIIMRQSGNMHQFAFLPSPEPTYAKIYEGDWLDDERPYHVVHRIASYPDVHGIFSCIMDYCFSHDPNIRIDTHRDNRIMQHNILKHGFTYCGIIYLLSGDERLAYQKVVNR